MTASSSSVSTKPTNQNPPPITEWSSFGRDRRQEIINRIECHTKRTLLCYVALDAQISREDVVYFRELLHTLSLGTPVDLLLNSPGGDIDTAEKLVQMILQVTSPRNMPSTEFRLVVPDRAKSAATLIALGANIVVMGNTSELGPIDPQVILPDQRGIRNWYAVCDYIEAYEEAKDNYRTNPRDPVFRIVMEKFDPVLVKSLERANERVRTCAENLLKLHGGNFTLAPSQLMDRDTYPSHGQLIGWETARDHVGLDVSFMDRDDDLWQLYWRLYCYLRSAVEGRRKIFESSRVSILV